MSNPSRYFEAQILYKDDIFMPVTTVVFKLGDSIDQEDDKIFYYLQSESELETLRGETESIEDFYILSYTEISNPFIY